MVKTRFDMQDIDMAWCPGCGHITMHRILKEALEELKTNWGEQWPSEVAHVYAWVGDADAAFEWLDRAVAQNEDGLTQQFPQPFFIPIHDDPRWQTFREQTGTSAAQLSAIEFKVPVLK